MGRYSVKRYKTKRRTRDLDLIYDDISLQSRIQQLKKQELDEDKPGLGQYYCIECAKYFESQQTLERHTKSKVHKRRLKDLKQRPYTTLEAEAASGVNLNKFIESVEKYKAIEQYKNDHKDEFDRLKSERNDTLDALITGIPSSELNDADKGKAGGEVEMKD